MGVLQLCKDVQDIREFQKRVTWFGFKSRKTRETRIVFDNGDFVTICRYSDS